MVSLQVGQLTRAIWSCLRSALEQHNHFLRTQLADEPRGAKAKSIASLAKHDGRSARPWH